ncbi:MULTISPECIES: Spy/CpxP family protein refolding chaperone [unclassified Microbulbifer]|uniref:Spy/CpxP family protein refolding chaperone n=1 Tax=unclassified Microbulbifer TaxID=2619833 RepID=UPI001E582DAD|nr:Spy/CpxP family protein refolding chaperone [Microbulbifer sp. YPW16]UHQ54929.1 Spy/CpxP family protein refolding chaperone [Microbulbifer sp. YPW16]
MNYRQWKNAITGIGLAAVIAVPTLGMAGDFGHRHGDKSHKMQQRIERLAEKLELTEGQKAQLVENHDAVSDERRELMREAHSLRKELRNALADEAGRATLDALAMKIGQLKIRRMELHQNSRQQFLAVLTDEQKAELRELREERQERRAERRERKGA